MQKIYSLFPDFFFPDKVCPFIRDLIPKNLKRRLSITFNDQLQYKKLKNGVKFVFCPDSPQFGEDWSHNWKNYTNNEKLEDAAQILRKEIKGLKSLFLSWQPPKKDIVKE